MVSCENSPACTWFFSILLFGVVIPMTFLGLGTLFLSSKYRQHVIFSKRNPWLVLTEVISMLFAFTAYCLNSIFPATDAATCLILYFLGGFVGLCAILFRLVALYLALSMSSHIQKLQTQRSKQTLTVKDSWWLRNRKHFNLRNLMVAGVVLAGVSLSVVVFVLRQVNTGGEEKLVKTSTAALSFWLFVTIGVLYLTRLLQTTGHENFGIKRELRRKIISGAILILAILLGYNKNVKQFSEDVVSVRMLLSWPAIVIEIYISVWQVILDIWRDLNARAMATSVSDMSDILEMSLIDVLTDEQLVAAFREFLCSELSVEHLYFIQTYQNWKANWEPLKTVKIDALQWKAYVGETLDIFNEYVDHNAVASVNISSSTRELAKQEMVNLKAMDSVGTIDVAIFEKVYDEVYQLLSLDSMMRFKKDDKFRQICLSRKLSDHQQQQTANYNIVEIALHKISVGPQVRPLSPSSNGTHSLRAKSSSANDLEGSRGRDQLGHQ